MKYIKPILIIIWIIITVLLTVLLVRSCSREQDNNQNIKALTDSLHTVRTREGDLLAYKAAYVMTKDELDRYTKFSKAEISSLEKQLQSKIDIISKIKGEVRVDTIVMHDSIVSSGDTITDIFTFNDDWIDIRGSSIFYRDSASTTISSISTQVPLTVGLTSDENFFASTPNPYVSISSIECGDIRKKSKKKYWSIGIQAGFGAGYDIIHKNISAGPYIGVGLGFGFDF